MCRCKCQKDQGSSTLSTLNQVESIYAISCLFVTASTLHCLSEMAIQAVKTAETCSAASYPLGTPELIS